MSANLLASEYLPRYRNMCVCQCVFINVFSLHFSSFCPQSEAVQCDSYREAAAAAVRIPRQPGGTSSHIHKNVHTPWFTHIKLSKALHP